MFAFFPEQIQPGEVYPHLFMHQSSCTNRAQGIVFPCSPAAKSAARRQRRKKGACSGKPKRLLYICLLPKK
jgi:hypothetical protein